MICHRIHPRYSSLWRGGGLARREGRGGGTQMTVAYQCGQRGSDGGEGVAVEVVVEEEDGDAVAPGGQDGQTG